MWLLLFIAVPAIEMFLLVEIGGRIGAVLTIGLVVFTGILGWSLVKYQGLSTIRRIREEMAQARMPAEEMVGGLCLIGAGIVLITPGFITDTVGFLMLVPWIRRRVAGYLIRRFRPKVTRVQTARPPWEGL